MIRSGQSFLALVIIVGGIVLAIGVYLTFVAVSFVNSEYGYQAAASADAAAMAGAEDALLQLDRNIGFSSGGYSLAVGSTTATVTVTQNSPATNFITVLAKATVFANTRKVNVVLAKNASTSALTVTSWSEIQ